MTLEEAYSILSVTPSDSDEAIKKAYRSLMKKYHPDVCNNLDIAEHKSKLINEAYELIGRKRHSDVSTNYHEWIIIKAEVHITDLYERQKSTPLHQGFLTRTFNRKKGYRNIWDPTIEDYTNFMLSFCGHAESFLNDVFQSSSYIFKNCFVRKIAQLASEEYVDIYLIHNNIAYRDASWLKNSIRLKEAVNELDAMGTLKSNKFYLSNGFFIDNKELILCEKEKMKRVFDALEKAYVCEVSFSYFDTFFSEGSKPENSVPIYAFHFNANSSSNVLPSNELVDVGVGKCNYDEMTENVAFLIATTFKLTLNYQEIDKYCKSPARVFIWKRKNNLCVVELRKRKYPNNCNHFHSIRIYVY